MDIPVGISSVIPGFSSSGDSNDARRSKPADPGVEKDGISLKFLSFNQNIMLQSEDLNFFTKKNCHKQIFCQKK